MVDLPLNRWNGFPPIPVEDQAFFSPVCADIDAETGNKKEIRPHPPSGRVGTCHSLKDWSCWRSGA